MPFVSAIELKHHERMALEQLKQSVITPVELGNITYELKDPFHNCPGVALHRVAAKVVLNKALHSSVGGTLNEHTRCGYGHNVAVTFHRYTGELLKVRQLQIYVPN